MSRTKLYELGVDGISRKTGSKFRYAVVVRMGQEENIWAYQSCLFSLIEEFNSEVVLRSFKCRTLKQTKRNLLREQNNRKLFQDKDVESVHPDK